MIDQAGCLKGAAGTVRHTTRERGCRLGGAFLPRDVTWRTEAAAAKGDASESFWTVRIEIRL
jgi:hypothetical protein